MTCLNIYLFCYINYIVLLLQSPYTDVPTLEFNSLLANMNFSGLELQGRIKLLLRNLKKGFFKNLFAIFFFTKPQNILSLLTKSQKFTGRFEHLPGTRFPRFMQPCWDLFRRRGGYTYKTSNKKSKNQLKV